jgi:hypothetical protein
MFRARTFLTALLVLVSAVPAMASIQGQQLGTAAPPATLGGFSMTPFGPDPSALFSNVTQVASPLGGTVDFSNPVNHRKIGMGWATWSHGYLGDVYYTNGLTSISFDLPASTGAFYFYAEPNPFQTFLFTATTDSGTQLQAMISGQAAAAGFGFYTDASDTIASISVSSTVDFAIGEFGIAQVSVQQVVPEAQALIVWSGLIVSVGLVAALNARKNSRSVT